jgi:hypothetical protein
MMCNQRSFAMHNPGTWPASPVVSAVLWPMLGPHTAYFLIILPRRALWAGFTRMQQLGQTPPSFPVLVGGGTWNLLVLISVTRLPSCDATNKRDTISSSDTVNCDPSDRIWHTLRTRATDRFCFSILTNRGSARWSSLTCCSGA